MKKMERSKTSILWFALLLFLTGSGSATGATDPGANFTSWPDTGQTNCYDQYGHIITCPPEGTAFHGQDPQYSDLGRSYTKLDANGNELPDNAQTWVMVRDNITGLIWETKNNRDNIPDYTNPHDTDNQYAWCDPDPATNGGNPGDCASYHNTKVFIDYLNATKFGGFDDWRLPTIKELAALVDYGQSAPAIIPEYFPVFAHDIAFYWSSTSTAFDTGKAWSMKFQYGSDEVEQKSNKHYVLAVRGQQ